MLSYTLRRLAGAIPTIFIIVTLTFFMIRLAPGGPFDLERPIDPLIMLNLQRAYGLPAGCDDALQSLPRKQSSEADASPCQSHRTNRSASSFLACKALATPFQQI